ncbi:hypothetical protein AB9M75_04365 [Lactobacillus sp. AN1001]
MKKDFEEILSKHANELKKELGTDNIFIGYIDNDGGAHGTVNGSAISALYGISSMLYKVTEQAHNLDSNIVTDKEVSDSKDVLSLYGHVYSEAMKLVKK